MGLQRSTGLRIASIAATAQGMNEKWALSRYTSSLLAVTPQTTENECFSFSLEASTQAGRNTRSHTHAHTQTHIRIHTRTHTEMQTYTHTHTHTRTSQRHKHTHTHTHKGTHTQTHTFYLQQRQQCRATWQESEGLSRAQGQINLFFCQTESWDWTSNPPDVR